MAFCCWNALKRSLSACETWTDLAVVALPAIICVTCKYATNYMFLRTEFGIIKLKVYLCRNPGFLQGRPWTGTFWSLTADKLWSHMAEGVLGIFASNAAIHEKVSVSQSMDSYMPWSWSLCHNAKITVLRMKEWFCMQGITLKHVPGSADRSTELPLSHSTSHLYKHSKAQSLLFAGVLVTSNQVSHCRALSDRS